MAISKQVDSPTGLVIQNAYIRINNICGNKDKITFSINAYLSKEAYLEGKAVITQNVFSFVPSSEEGTLRWDKQAYEYLKTLNEYKDAVDC